VEDLGGLERPLTKDEAEFLSLLYTDRPWLDVWRHQDADGTPWLIVSHDFTRGKHILRTLRLDFDGTAIRGGWSPASLNWDDGVRAEEAEVDWRSSEGLGRTAPVADLAQAAGEWFDAHREAFCAKPS
jgi:hypothetical protein